MPQELVIKVGSEYKLHRCKIEDDVICTPIPPLRVTPARITKKVFFLNRVKSESSNLPEKELHKKSF